MNHHRQARKHLATDQSQVMSLSVLTQTQAYQVQDLLLIMVILLNLRLPLHRQG